MQTQGMENARWHQGDRSVVLCDTVVPHPGSSETGTVSADEKTERMHQRRDDA